jgi:hypothetical protein
MKQIPRTTTPFSATHAKRPKRRALIDRRNEQRTRLPASNAREPQMRTFSFLFAFAVFLVGPCMAGSSAEHAAHIGTFSYSGTPVTGPASALVMAAR